MTGEPPQAPIGVSAAAPSAGRGKLPFPFWLVFGLGVFSSAAWLGALLLDTAASENRLTPAWMWNGVRILLVLAVPALVLFVTRSWRMPARRLPRAYFAVMALIMIAAATPAFFPFSPTSNPESLLLRAPALALGVALATVDPLVIERWRRDRSRDSSLAMSAGVGFGATVIVAVAVAVYTAPPAQCTGIGCELAGVFYISVCGGALITAAIGLFEVWLGYVIGAWVARADYWW